MAIFCCVSRKRLQVLNLALANGRRALRPTRRVVVGYSTVNANAAMSWAGSILYGRSEGAV